MNARIRSLFLALLLACPLAFAEQGTLTADGNTTATQPITRPHVHVSGDFGGGTITFYFQDNAGSYHAIDGAAFTSASDVTLDLNRPTVIRGTLTGSTSPGLIWIVN